MKGKAIFPVAYDIVRYRVSVEEYVEITSCANSVELFIGIEIYMS